MLRKLLFVSLAVVTIASCKKSKNDTPAYFLSAKIDGVKIDFSSAVAAEKSGDAQNGYIVYILGIGGNASISLPAFDLTINDDAAIIGKTYTAAQNKADGSYTAVNQSTYDSDTEFSITITSITETEVKGTFSGKIVEDGSLNVVNVTEGSFSARII
jgi:hypothetical protein